MAETRFSNSLADFGGAAEDLQDLFAHAKETLGMYSPAASNDAKAKDDEKSPAQSVQAEQLESKPDEGYHETVDTKERGSPILRPPEPAISCVVCSPQDLELDILISAVDAHPFFQLDRELDLALRKASRSIDESLDFIAPMMTHTAVEFGIHLPPERLEALFGQAEVFLGQEIPEDHVELFIETARNLADSKSNVITEEESHAFATEMEQTHKDEMDITSPGSVETNEDNLSQLYRKAYIESSREEEPPLEAPPNLSPQRPPDFGALAASRARKRGFAAAEAGQIEYHALTGNEEAGGKKSWLQKSTPLSPKRNPILSRFLELNRQDQFERTQSGRDIPAISPVTEPTMGDRSLIGELRTRLMGIPDLDVGDDMEMKSQHEMEEGNAMAVDDSSRNKDMKMEEASFDTFKELEAILSATKQEYGTDLSMDLIAAIKKAASLGPESLQDSGSLIMSQIDLERDEESHETEEASLQGLAIQLTRKLSCDSRSLSSFIVTLRDKLCHSRGNSSRSLVTKQLVNKEYFRLLIETAESELGIKIPIEICERIRKSGIEVLPERNPIVPWEELESALQSACEGYDEDVWFETQEAFFKAWESCEAENTRQKISKWANASGYISAVSEGEGSVSVLMDDPDDFDNMDDILEEVKRIHGGNVPKEILKDLQLSGSDLEYSRSSASFFRLSQQSLDFDYSQSSFDDHGSVPQNLSMIKEVSSDSSQGTNPSARQSEKLRSIDPSLDNISSSIRGRSVASSFSGVASKDSYDGSVDYDDDSLSESSESLKSAPTNGRSKYKPDDDEMSNADTIEESPLDRNILTQSLSMPPVRPPVERSLSTHSAHSAHGVTVNRSLGHNILKEVSKVYKQTLPEELVFVLKHSLSIPYSTNSDEDIRIILANANPCATKHFLLI